MLLIPSTSLSFAAPTEPVQRELVAITQALFDSIGSGNADFWARALTDDAFVIDELGQRQEKPEIVKSIRRSTSTRRAGGPSWTGGPIKAQTERTMKVHYAVTTFRS